jgi:hypothetical protein
MRRTVNVHDFRQAFVDYDRAENFSYAGLEALFEYLVSLEEDTGEEMELDVIGICCDFSEYENIKEFQENYGDEYQTIEDVEERTTVIPVDGDRFIIQQF